MTYLLGWSTHAIYEDQWRVLKRFLDAEDPSVFYFHSPRLGSPNLEQCPVAMRELVDDGLLSEKWTANGVRYALTDDGAEFARRLMPDYID